MLQHNDIAIVPIDSLPAGCCEIPGEDGGFVLAGGDDSTRTCVLLEGGLGPFGTNARLFETDGCKPDRFLILRVECELLNESRKSITIPPGLYRVIHGHANVCEISEEVA